MTTLFEFSSKQIADKFFDEVSNDGIFNRMDSIGSKVSIISINEEQELRLAKYKSLAARYYNAVFKDITGV